MAEFKVEEPAFKTGDRVLYVGANGAYPWFQRREYKIPGTVLYGLTWSGNTRVLYDQVGAAGGVGNSLASNLKKIEKEIVVLEAKTALVGPKPTPSKGPKVTTPFVLDGGVGISDADGHRVLYVDGGNLDSQEDREFAKYVLAALNAYSGPVVLRDLTDSYGDNWFEVSPGRAVEKRTRAQAEEYAKDFPEGVTVLADQGYYVPFRDKATGAVIPEHLDL